MRFSLGELTVVLRAPLHQWRAAKQRGVESHFVKVCIRPEYLYAKIEVQFSFAKWGRCSKKVFDLNFVN